MSFGEQVQSRATRLLGRAQTVDGRVVTISEIEYSEAIAGVGTRGVAVDVGGSQNAGAISYGFADRDQAERFLTGLEAEDYTVTDAAGRTMTQTRVGLGIPDGMIRWIDNARSVGNVVPAVAAVIPPNAAQYPQQAAALNSPPDAADQPQGHLSGEGGQRDNTVDTRAGGDAGAQRAAFVEQGSGDPKADGDGQGAGPNKADKNHDSNAPTPKGAKNS